MIIVTGTLRSGTSMWMQILVAAGFPFIGERFPAGWEALVGDANPDGFYESQLVGGIYHRTNPHPVTGEYLVPAHTRSHAVKVLLPGLVRTDVAFIDRCIATVRDWRRYVESVAQLRALSREARGSGEPAELPARDVEDFEDLRLPPALEWWSENYALIRDLATRHYPVHVCSYQSLLHDPGTAIGEVLEWLGDGDLEAAKAVVRSRGRSPSTARALASDDPPEELGTRHTDVFDELYRRIHEGHALDAPFVETLNALDRDLRPRILQFQAKARLRAARRMLDGHFGESMEEPR